MDFVTELPLSNGFRNLLVVTDRLSKDLVLVPLVSLDTENVAEAFLERVVAYHWLPDYIVSDRGAQFLSGFWTTLCGKLGVTRRLSTAYHPETDGATERMNAVVESFLRAYVNWQQDDWVKWLPAAQIAIKGRIASATGVSPFFLQHGYEIDPIQEDAEWVAKQQNREIPAEDASASAIAAKFREVLQFAKSKMAVAQQDMEKHANKRRQEAPVLRIGDRVWLRYGKNLSNGRLSKKLDWKNACFEVLEVVSPHSVRLNVPGQLHSVFHVDRLRLASRNPRPGQRMDDSQPDAVVETEEGEKEYRVEQIVGEKLVG